MNITSDPIQKMHGVLEWNGISCLDSRLLCLAVDQLGCPNCSRSRATANLEFPSPQGHRKTSAVPPLKYWMKHPILRQATKSDH